MIPNLAPFPTTLISAPRIGQRLGLDLIIASETFQRTGSFKYRAAFNVASRIPHPRVITASSGNYGHAIAAACRGIGKHCTVVMPNNSAKVKIEAVEEMGAKVDLIDVRTKSRQDRIRELSELDSEAYVSSPYDDPLVIEGNSSLGEELAKISVDAVVAPVGGGGLLSGLIVGLRRGGFTGQIFGVEPETANDAARSLRAGTIQVNTTEPPTIADGVRTVSIGAHNWEVIHRGVTDILEVAEEQIVEAFRMLFFLSNLKAEPTGAVGLAGIIARNPIFRGKRTCCVVSGGNVDPDIYCELLGRKRVSP